MDKVAIAVKRTKYERDLRRLGSSAEARRLYSIHKEAFEKVYSSHERQLDALKKITEALPEADLIYRESLAMTDFSIYDYVISFGGDNHFVFVSHFLGGKPIAGINSDPETSQGALLHFTTDQFINELREAHSRDKKIDPSLEKWSLIEGTIETIDGTFIPTGTCTSEISIRNRFPESMGRYLIHKGSDPFEEQKSTGLLLATGAGSTGWYRNSLPYAMQKNAAFAKDAPYFRTVARELGQRNRKNYQYGMLTVEKGSKLELVSEMDGEVIIDCHPERSFSFPQGSKATFFISNTYLNIITGLNRNMK